MKKLACRKYLNQPNLTREKLCAYTGHLLKAHRHNLPNGIVLAELATSSSTFNQRAYEEVSRLAQQAEKTYSEKKG